MTTLRWDPSEDFTAQEDMLLRTVRRTKKLFGFLRRHRLQLFDDAFQEELAAVYRRTGAGKSPHPPAFLAMVVLLQAYTKTSDAEAVQQCVVDLRWQMVLDCLGATTPPFSQGALHDFRHRLIEQDLDRRLLERTAELAKETKAFDAKKLPKTIRVAVDSKPLQGAGRVEDTLNLLGHAARDVVRYVAVLTDSDPDDVATEAGIPLLLETSTKLALDTNWTDPKRKAQALQKLMQQLRNLLSYVQSKLPDAVEQAPLREPLDTLQQIIDQDLEPDPDDPKGRRVRIRQGVAKDRRVSIQDGDMRHGRKTRTKAFNGFKQHVLIDVDRTLVLACAVVGANRREHEAMPALHADLGRQDVKVSEALVDRGYTTAEFLDLAARDGWRVLSKPRQMPPNQGRFTKRDFQFNLRDRTVSCPAGQTEPFVPGAQVRFDSDECAACQLRAQCTSSPGGRTLNLSADELEQQRFVRLAKSKSGRQRLRARVPVEHRLAHLKQKQGDHARYLGERANLFDLRRTSALLNLEVIQHQLAEAAKADGFQTDCRSSRLLQKPGGWRGGEAVSPGGSVRRGISLDISRRSGPAFGARSSSRRRPRVFAAAC